MRLNDNFIITVQDGVQILVDSSAGFHGIIKNTGSASFIVECLKNDTTAEEIAEKMLLKYEVDELTAKNDILKTVKSLKSVGAIIE